MKIDTSCPKCGGASRDGLTAAFRFAEEPGMKPIVTQIYVCTAGCMQEVPYPEPGQWDLEFVIIDGKKHVCRPTASEFA